MVEHRATLESVAQLAGVSRQTVSNVINSPGLVLPETRARVQQAIDELGYRPHAGARALRTRRSRILGLCVPPSGDGISGEILDRFLHAVTERAQRHDMRVMVFTAPDDDAEIAEYGALLDTADLDGFVLTNTHGGDPRARWLAERGVPFVTFGRPWPSDGAQGAPDAHAWVDIDGSAGTRTATKHLISLGHTAIAFLGWPAGSGSGDDRHGGWATALADAGLDAGAARVGRTVDGVEPGRVAAGALIAGGATAIVCASDSLALGALAASRQGVGTSAGAVAVVGFDDTPVARAVGFSSVAQPVGEVADHVVTMLRAQIDRTDEPAARQVLIVPELVVRGSILPPTA